MGVMKKDVNFIFFILIIAVVVSFAGFTAYYQISFRNINVEYDTKLAELNKVTVDLLEKKAALLETSSELDTTKQGREELGERYDDLKDDRDTLKDERDSFRDNLYKTRTELDQKKAQVTALSTQLIVAEDEADKWKGKYDSCKEDLEDCEAVCPG
jgi:chromosome segregation ATPase